MNPMLESLPKRLGSVVSRRESFALALIGEAGIGKSYQLDRLVQNLTCRSVQLPANAGGVLLARSFVGHDRVPSWAVRSLERLEAGETLTPARLADAITAHLLANAPFVLLLEDFHEANLAQLEVWSGVAQALKATRGVALLAAGRGVPPDPFESVRLEALDLLESRSMLEAQIGAVLPDAALTWIQARANGHPLFTLEYFRFLARSGFLWSDARRWRWRDPGGEVMPTSVEALVAQALEPLRDDPPLQATLRARAVLPDDDLARWCAVAELSTDQLGVAQRRLESDGLLQRESSGRLALQPILATVLRSTLEPQIRRDLSCRAIRALEHDWPEMAAMLVDEADLESNDAIALLERGAAGGTDRRAAGFLLRAAERSAPADRARRSLLAARALRAFDSDEALRLVMLAGALEPNDQTTLLEAELLATQGRFLEAERCALRLQPASQVAWLEVLLEARYRLDDDAGVLEIWEANPALQLQASVTLRVRVGYALVQLGGFDQAGNLYRQMLKTKLVAEDRAWVLSAAAIVELDAGDLKAAAEGFSQSLAAFERLDQSNQPATLEAATALRQVRRVATLANRSMVRYRLGDFTGAIADLEVVLAHHSEHGDGRSFAETQTNLGTYLIAQAEFERAEEMLLEARAVLERMTVGAAAHQGENPRMLSLAEQGLVQLYLEWGPPHGAALALRHAQAAERAARQVQNPTNLAQTLFYCAWAEAVHGRPERAQTMGEELEALAQTFKLEPMCIAANWVQGLALERLGQVEAGRAQILAASQQMRALGHLAYAHRLALEADRIAHDLGAAQMRLEELSAYPGWQAVAKRYFPQVIEATSKPAPTAQTTGARLNVLGALRLESNFETITPPALQGKILLALLLEARLTGREGVKTLEMLDVLYPEHEESMGAGALKQLVFRTRTSLGKAAILRINDGYALGTLETDAELFLASGESHLWRGPLLSDLSEDIAPALRDALGEALQRSVETLIETDPPEAARLAEIMRETDPYDHDALRHQLRALERCADLRKLDRIYAQARFQLLEVGEDLPESWRTFLQQSRA